MPGSFRHAPEEVKTVRTRRTWFEKVEMWQRAFETKIRDERREATGRGATPGIPKSRRKAMGRREETKRVDTLATPS
jgi:hypothetical protein